MNVFLMKWCSGWCCCNLVMLVLRSVWCFSSGVRLMLSMVWCLIGLVWVCSYFVMSFCMVCVLSN